MLKLYTRLQKVKKANRESLLNALRNLSDFDLDFNGDNGVDYLWDEVDSNKFGSNMEYLISKIKSIKDDEECVRIFFEEWMKHDKNYYNAYEYNTITKNGNIIAISFSAVSED